MAFATIGRGVGAIALGFYNIKNKCPDDEMLPNKKAVAIYLLPSALGSVVDYIVSIALFGVGLAIVHTIPAGATTFTACQICGMALMGGGFIYLIITTIIGIIALSVEINTTKAIRSIMQPSS